MQYMHIENEMEMAEVAFNILIRFMIELLFPHDHLAQLRHRVLRIHDIETY